jgi:hypothetical protein
MPRRLVRANDLQRRSRMAGLPAPACAHFLRRNDFGAGLANGESDDGGFDEFDEFCPSCRFNSATSARSCAITPA